MNANIKSKVEDFLGNKIKSANSVSGGCIADSKIIQTETGKQYFLKTHSGTPGMFFKEGNSLKELAKPECIRVPKVLLSDDNFLLIEHIPQGGRGNNFFKYFGEAFAQMHKYTSDSFGFFEDRDGEMR